MSDAASEGLSAGAHAGPIDVDVYCFGCRYNLRGLELGAVCPECSQPVQGSFEPELLLWTSPQTRWLIARRLMQFQWLVTGTVLQIMASVHLMRTHWQWPGHAPSVIGFIALAVQSLAPLLWLAAWSRLWFSHRDFGFNHPLVVEPARAKFERTACTSLMVIWIVYLICQVVLQARYPLHDTVWIIIMVMMCFLFLNWLHQVIALRTIARLCQSPPLQRVGTVLLILVPIVLICGLPLILGPTLWLIALVVYTDRVRQALLNQPTSKIPNPLVE